VANHHGGGYNEAINNWRKWVDKLIGSVLIVIVSMYRVDGTTVFQLTWCHCACGAGL